MTPEERAITERSCAVYVDSVWAGYVEAKPDMGWRVFVREESGLVELANAPFRVDAIRAVGDAYRTSRRRAG